MVAGHMNAREVREVWRNSDRRVSTQLAVLKLNLLIFIDRIFDSNVEGPTKGPQPHLRLLRQRMTKERRILQSTTRR